ARAGVRAPACLVPLRRVHRRVPGQDPAPRAAARVAERPGGRARRALARASGLHALVTRLVVAARLPPLDRARPARPAARGGPRPGPRMGARPSRAAPQAPLPRPQIASWVRASRRRSRALPGGGLEYREATP